MHHSKRLLMPLVLIALVLSTMGVAMAHRIQPATTKPIVDMANNGKLGKILVNSKGFTLYHLVKEDTGKNVCASSSQCRAIWPPLLLPNGVSKPTAGTGVTDKLGTIDRPGLGKQVTYDGWPLYTYAGDSKAGDTTGQDFMHIWFAVPVKPKVRFKISITTSGATVWGTIKLHYKYHHKKFHASCSKSTCKVKVHAGSKVHLSQTPTDSGTWPFSGWSVKAKDTSFHRTSTSSTIKVKSNDSYHITATYTPSTYP